MKCLRCRKEAVSNSSFCDVCLKTVSVPLEPSPYLNTQIHLNRKKKPSSAQASSTAPKAEKNASSKNGWRTAAIILFLFCLILAAGCAYLSRDFWLSYLP